MWRKFRIFLTGLMDSLIGRGDAAGEGVAMRGELLEHKRLLEQIRKTLTGLIYQRKTLEAQIGDVIGRLGQLEEDLQDAVQENREELGVKLLEQRESLSEEERFIRQQLSMVEKDIVQVRERQEHLNKTIHRAEQMMGTLASRREVVNMRKRLRTEMGQLGVLGNFESKLSESLDNQMRRLEAEDEVARDAVPSWQREVEGRRSQRREQKYANQFEQLRKQRHASQRVLVGEVVR